MSALPSRLPPPARPQTGRPQTDRASGRASNRTSDRASDRSLMGRPQRRRDSRAAIAAARTSQVRTQLLEAGLKLATCGTIAALAIAGIVKLVPQYQQQELEVQQLRSETYRLDHRVRKLRSEFSEYFDPQKAANAMQKETFRTQPKERHLVWRDRFEEP